MYRVMAKSARRVPRIIQMLMRMHLEIVATHAVIALKVANDGFDDGATAHLDTAKRA
jgi:hypothetical protein